MLMYTSNPLLAFCLGVLLGGVVATLLSVWIVFKTYDLKVKPDYLTRNHK